MSALLLGEAERAALLDLRTRAEANPIDGLAAIERAKTPEGLRDHVQTMQGQSITLPPDTLVFFSVETGHPGGPARHLSVSDGRPGRVPSVEAISMIGELLGIVGGPEAWDLTWPVKIPNRSGIAISVIQFLATAEAAGGPQ